MNPLQGLLAILAGQNHKYPELIWTCHICGRERPDVLIGVLAKPLVVRGEVLGNQNVRYCKDNPSCFEGAKTYEFYSEKEE
jgi:hypothetical protein